MNYYDGLEKVIAKDIGLTHPLDMDKIYSTGMTSFKIKKVISDITGCFRHIAIRLVIFDMFDLIDVKVSKSYLEVKIGDERFNKLK